MTASPNHPHVGLVVEGAGDRGAVPVLLRKHLESKLDFRDILGKPVPAHGRPNATVAGGLEGYVATAAARPGCVGVLVVLDGDDDCVARLGPELLERAASTTGKPVYVSLAERDFEDWLHASAETLGLELEFDPSKNGKATIPKALKPAKYVKPTLQPRLAARMDLDLATSRSQSLARLLLKFDELVEMVL